MSQFLVCISNETLSMSLTIGKVYEVVGDIEWEDEYKTIYIEFNGHTVWFPKSSFITLEEFRDIKIKILLD